MNEQVEPAGQEEAGAGAGAGVGAGVPELNRPVDELLTAQ